MAVLTKDIQDVIRKTLPEMAAGALKERLAELEQKEADFDLLEHSHDSVQKDKAKLTHEVRSLRKDLKEIEDREAVCKDREERNAENERGMELRILRIQLNEQDKRIGDLMTVNFSLTRNLEYRNKVVRRDAEGSLVAESTEEREVR